MPNFRLFCCVFMIIMREIFHATRLRYLVTRLFSVNSPLHFWPVSQVSAPVSRHHHQSNMAVVWTLVPTWTLYSARKSCAVASSSAAVRNESVLDRTRCHNRCWNLRCRSKELTLDWILCGWDEGLCIRSKATKVDWSHCNILEEKHKRKLKLGRAVS